MCFGPIQTESLVVIRVIAVFVLIQKVVRIKWLVRVIRVSNPTRYSDRRNVQRRIGLVRISLREIVIE